MPKLLTKIILILTLAVCASSAVSAQGVGPVGFYTGIESAAGTCEMTVTSTCFGNTYALNSFGEWESHHLTVSLNYFNSLPGGGNGFAVTGGDWSLVVIRENQYAGTLYGKVTDGSIVYPPTDDEKSKKIIEVNLQATGGLGIFNNKRRKKITSTLKMTTNLNSRETTGRLDITF
jgi:hypothetical protein